MQFVLVLMPLNSVIVSKDSSYERQKDQIVFHSIKNVQLGMFYVAL